MLSSGNITVKMNFRFTGVKVIKIILLYTYTYTYTSTCIHTVEKIQKRVGLGR